MASSSVWSYIDHLTQEDDISSSCGDAGDKKGELVVVGTGIASLRQMTVEALDYIQRADMVFYVVLDAMTECFIQTHAKKHHDLYQYYDKNKPRNASYVQMAELMVQSVRDGNLTVAVYYGHPGVFVFPTHRAIHIAREEGYKAKMLPGVSAEDCLYADLGIDPGTTGCSMFEATYLLNEPDRLDPRNHVIIWQPGCVGKSTMVFDNSEIHELADYLEKTYGPEYPIIAYLAAVRPFNDPQIDKLMVKDLRDLEKLKAIPFNAATTLYIPPKTLPVVPQDMEDPIELQLARNSAFRMSHPEMNLVDNYTKQDKQWVEDLKHFVPPNDYKRMTASTAMRRAAIKLALLHHRLHGVLPRELIADRALSKSGLTPNEAESLRVMIDNLDLFLREGVERPPAVNGVSVIVFALLIIRNEDQRVNLHGGKMGWKRSVVVN
ncbi:hypothetical protein AC578_10601 [Pseudocercospora eumusae]|uniref:Tetrapyrrole methylase domain-containing protein n=1 Tax=Pseudocercospora eumusae TaxID=321146 RepID=A0A139HKF9_9PEZI|nr:hypothetical protein AC578_10601 [Pseudocercospora eumusae]